MAGIAIGAEDGADSAFEELDLIRRESLRSVLPPTRQNQAHQDENDPESGSSPRLSHGRF